MHTAYSGKATNKYREIITQTEKMQSILTENLETKFSLAKKKIHSYCTLLLSIYNEQKVNIGTSHNGGEEQKTSPGFSI